MKKKLWIIVAAVLLAVVLLTPIPIGPANDGGTRQYAALSYKVVKWNHLTLTGIYDETRVYFFPDNFKSLDELLVLEEERMQNRFLATVVEVEGSTVLV